MDKTQRPVLLQLPRQLSQNLLLGTNEQNTLFQPNINDPGVVRIVRGNFRTKTKGPAHRHGPRNHLSVQTHAVDEDDDPLPDAPVADSACSTFCNCCCLRSIKFCKSVI